MSERRRDTGDGRYEHTGVGGSGQRQGERKDEGWTSRQGGEQSRERGRHAASREPAKESRGRPPRGTNTQGDLSGIGEAADDVTQELPKDEAGEPAVPER